MERNIPSVNSAVALFGIDREVPVYRPLAGILEGVLQNAASLALRHHLGAVGEKQRDTDTREVVNKQQEKK